MAGLYDDLDPTALFYTPDLSSPAIHPVWHVNGDARLTVQATPRNKSTPTTITSTPISAPASIPRSTDRALGVRPLQERPPVVRPGELELARHQQSVARGGRDDHRPELDRATGSGRAGRCLGHHGIVHEFTWRAPTAGFGGTRNNQSNYRAAVSYVTGTHAAKVGLTLLQQWRVVGNDRNNGVNYTFFNGVPSGLTQFAEPITFRERVNYNLGLYAQDQWTIGRLTLNLGVRADFLNAQVDAQSLPAGPLIAAREFAESRTCRTGGPVSPRGRRVRSVRQRQDRDQSHTRPVRRGRVVHHRARRRTRCSQRSVVRRGLGTTATGNFTLTAT